MSLTGHLQSSSGPARAWFDDELGDTRATVGAANRLLCSMRATDPDDDDTPAWFLWGVTDAGEPDALSGAWPVRIADDIDAGTATAAALQHVIDHISMDLTKGVGPFKPGGIAGAARQR